MNNNHKKVFFKLLPAVQNYKWGKIGASSIISKFIPDFNDSLEYAEMWIGAHPKAPASIEGSEKNLIDLLNEKGQDILGKEIFTNFRALPFLFKILSVNSALSIQTHPNKELAKELHLKDPVNYPDNNHKPELAIAITDLELLYGFRTLDEIKDFALKITAFKFILKENTFEKLSSNIGNNPELLKEIYSQILLATEDQVLESRNLLSEYISSLERLTPEDLWLEELLKMYPKGDRGILSFYILKYHNLRAGEALFIANGVPHAYLRGDLIECMATSDNVIRAGLTYKFCDAEVLIDMLDYTASGEILDIQKTVSPNFLTYDTPAKEFKVSKLSKGFDEDFSYEGVELLFCFSGTAILDDEINLQTGDAYLISNNCKNYNIKILEGETFHVRVPI